MTYTFTAAERAQLVQYDQGAWRTRWNNANLQNRTTTTVGPLQVEVSRTANESNSHAKIKLQALKAAFDEIRKAGVLFAAADLAVVNVGLSHVGESFGVVSLSNNAANTLPTVWLYLGPRVHAHTRAAIQPTQQGGRPGGSTGNPPRTVADRLYDYYKPSWTVNAKNKCSFAQVLHELGHVIHQLNNCSSFHDFTIPPAAGSPAQTRNNQINAVGQNVSEYASRGEPNEFIAEVFSGQVAGVHWNTIDPNIRATFDQYFGIQVPAPHTLKDTAKFAAQGCGCSGAGNGTQGPASMLTW